MPISRPEAEKSQEGEISRFARNDKVVETNETPERMTDTYGARLTQAESLESETALKYFEGETLLLLAMGVVKGAFRDLGEEGLPILLRFILLRGFFLEFCLEPPPFTFSTVWS